MDHLGGPSVIMRAVRRERQESQRQKRRLGHRSRGWSDAVMNQGVQVVSRSWTRQRTDCLLELPEETQPFLLTP